jgi:hypothetical protein
MCLQGAIYRRTNAASMRAEQTSRSVCMMPCALTGLGLGLGLGTSGLGLGLGTSGLGLGLGTTGLGLGLAGLHTLMAGAAAARARNL